LPTYEYACESCGHQYEKREGFDAKARQKCPNCGKMAQRVLSRPAIVFKGSGFYKTDSRGSDSGESSSSTSPSTSPSATPPATTPAADGGHSHGPGTHTHDAPAPATSTGTEAAAAS
jgi:putative FmdB family regulatory protein